MTGQSIEIERLGFVSSGRSRLWRSCHQHFRDSHEVVGEHCCSNQQLEAFAALGKATLHAAASEQYGDASLDAGTKTLALFEGGAVLIGFALRCLPAATLRNARHFDAGLFAQCQVWLAEESAIRTVHLRGPAKGLLVALKG